MAATPQLTFVPGRRKGTVNAILNGDRFMVDRKRDDRTYMKCVLHAKGCKARITVVNHELISAVPTHPSHDTQYSETHVHVAKQTLKKRAAQTDLPTKHIVAESVGGMNFETRSKLNCQLQALGKMSRSSRHASHNYPSNPRTLEDLILPPDYLHTSSGETLLLWDSGYTIEKRRSFLFGTPQNTSSLLGADHLIIDGTFKSSPKMFTQMVGIHGIFEGGYHMPLAYGLLPGKTQTLYTDLFEALDDFGSYEPQSVLCDYEAALHNAIVEVWPGVTPRGCFFHFTQAMWRNLQKTDLVPEYRVENSPIRAAFKKMTALAFVPEDVVPEAWRALKPTIPKDMETFVDYFERTWVGTSYKAPIFAHSRWSQHDATALLLPRSSNIAEGWHHGFNSLLSCSNPTIWKFLECLKKEQNLTDVKITKMMMREAPEPRAAKWRRYDERLQAVINNFYDYACVMDFLACVSNMI